MTTADRLLPIISFRSNGRVRPTALALTSG